MHRGRQLTGWRIGLQGCDNPGLRNFVRPAVIHIDRLQEKHIALLRHTRGDSLHDLAVDGLLVVGNEVLVQELLDLVGG